MYSPDFQTAGGTGSISSQRNGLQACELSQFDPCHMDSINLEQHNSRFLQMHFQPLIWWKNFIFPLLDLSFHLMCSQLAKRVTQSWPGFCFQCFGRKERFVIIGNFAVLPSGPFLLSLISLHLISLGGSYVAFYLESGCKWPMVTKELTHCFLVQRVDFWGVASRRLCKGVGEMADAL